MPFQSEAQRRFLWMHHPEVAQKWVDEGAASKGLPMHKKQAKRHALLGQMKHSSPEHPESQPQY